MLKKLRIGQIMDTLWLFLVVAALSIFMLSHAGLSSITALMGPRPLKSDADLDEMTGKYVTWEVKYPVDEYMETTKTTKVNGVSTGTKKDRSSWLVLDEDRGICLYFVSLSRFPTSAMTKCLPNPTIFLMPCTAETSFLPQA